jgi:ABC-type uncharacterized transport system fused permease/ATPase subunit
LWLTIRVFIFVIFVIIVLFNLPSHGSNFCQRRYHFNEYLYYYWTFLVFLILYMYCVTIIALAIITFVNCNNLVSLLTSSSSHAMIIVTTFIVTIIVVLIKLFIMTIFPIREEVMSPFVPFNWRFIFTKILHSKWFRVKPTLADPPHSRQCFYSRPGSGNNGNKVFSSVRQSFHSSLVSAVVLLVVAPGHHF